MTTHTVTVHSQVSGERFKAECRGATLPATLAAAVQAVEQDALATANRNYTITLTVEISA